MRIALKRINSNVVVNYPSDGFLPIYSPATRILSRGDMDNSEENGLPDNIIAVDLF